MHRKDAVVPGSHTIELVFETDATIRRSRVEAIGPASLRDQPDDNGEELVAFPSAIAPDRFVMTLSFGGGIAMPTGKGEMVTETFDYDGGRQVSVYLPAKSPEAVVFAGDGQLISPWGEYVADAGAPPTIVVGVHRSADETLRLHEYSPNFDPKRFAAHEVFFADHVRHWLRSRFGVALPRERTAVFGVSAGAELALAIGLRHPDVYGAVFCASPGAGCRPFELTPGSLPRTYFVAGRSEPFFRENAARWADALRNAGADVVMTVRDGTHGGDFWRTELPLMTAWAFGQQAT